MENTTTTEEDQDVETVSETSGNLELNGEAWKNRNNTTYTSLLDRYEAADLFSDKSMRLYQRLEEKKNTEYQELTEYIFSGQMQTKREEENMVERIFAEEIQLSKVRDYSRDEDDYSICFVMAEILFVLIFIFILMKINTGRRKRRETHAIKINMED